MSDKQDRKYRIRSRGHELLGWLDYTQEDFETTFSDMGEPIPDLAIGEEVKDDDLDTWVRTE